jgi:hypothetical protein
MSKITDHTWIYRVLAIAFLGVYIFGFVFLVGPNFVGGAEDGSIVILIQTNSPLNNMTFILYWPFFWLGETTGYSHIFWDHL